MRLHIDAERTGEKGRAMSGSEIAEPETIDPGSSGKLLIVDDDMLHRAVIARVARRAGYEIDEAPTYATARELIERRSYSCMTLDLTLGRHGGVEVLQDLARAGVDMPVLLVSGSDPAVREEAAEVGRSLQLNICGVFGKPMSLAVLRDVLSEIRKRQAVGLMPRVRKSA